MRDAPSYIVLIMTDTLLDTKHSKERASDTHEQDHEHDDQRIHLLFEHEIDDSKQPHRDKARKIPLSSSASV